MTNAGDKCPGVLYFGHQFGTMARSIVVETELTTQLNLRIVDGTFAICRLSADSEVLPWMSAGPFSSMSRSSDELSVVCRQDVVPGGVVCERGWRCLRVAGTIPFSVVGVLLSLTAPLAAAGISVFAVSTFDTDYLLVKEQDLDRAFSALRHAGHSIAES